MTALLFAALAQATASASAVGKRSKNDHHKYRYASSEDVIDEAREALSSCGLALVCTSARLAVLCDVEAVDGDGVLRRSTQWQAECLYLLVHSSGESLPITSCTPVLPEKGRPLDKALATAKTYDLAYTLRSLLLLPRLDPREIAEEPVDQRAERPERAAGPVPGGNSVERLIAGFAAATSGQEFDDLMRQASVAVRSLPESHPDRLACREAASAAKARIGGGK